MNSRKNIIFLLATIMHIAASLSAQEYDLKKRVTKNEILYLQKVVKEISKSDQRYRSYLTYGTLDDQIIEKIKAVMDSLGVEKGLKYSRSWNLSLSREVKDSLNNLQHEIDFTNHLKLRGIFNTYGFLPKDLLIECHWAQLVLLMHPPVNWDAKTYLCDYSKLFLEEVKSGRMPAKTYAMFYDNMKAKILREPQLYATNMRFDKKTNTIKPPIIESLVKSNKARKAIGLPALKEGEYMLTKD